MYNNLMIFNWWLWSLSLESPVPWHGSPKFLWMSKLPACYNSTHALGHCERKWPGWQSGHTAGNGWSHAQSSAMTGHWIILPPKFNFLQLVPNTTQRHRAQRLLEGHSDNKENKGNAGKWVQTVMFKEMTEIKKSTSCCMLCYVFLDSEFDSLSFPCTLCQGVLHPAMEYAHDGEFSGGQAEAAPGSFSHLEWTGIWQLILLIQAPLILLKAIRKIHFKNPVPLGNRWRSFHQIYSGRLLVQTMKICNLSKKTP